MKKLFLSTLVLLAFSVSILLFEISCKKSANAATQTTTTTTSVTQQNKILFVKNIPVPGSPGLYQGQIYSANYDGSNQQLINITLPSGIYISYTPVVTISPDRQTIFFSVSDLASNTGVFSANIDGSNPKQVVATDASGPWIQVAY